MSIIIKPQELITFPVKFLKKCHIFVHVLTIMFNYWFDQDDILHLTRDVGRNGLEDLSPITHLNTDLEILARILTSYLHRLLLTS